MTKIKNILFMNNRITKEQALLNIEERTAKINGVNVDYEQLTNYIVNVDFALNPNWNYSKFKVIAGM